jgi:hypothetical protein
MAKPSESDDMKRVSVDEAIVLWSDLYEVDRAERGRQRREAVDQVFSEGLMIALTGS